VKVAVPREIEQGERRVALVPDTAKMLVAAGLEVGVEAGAGAAAFISDDLYQKAGATVAGRAGSLLRDADAVLKVQAPRESEISLLKKGAVLISFLQPATQGDIVRSLASHGITAFSLELLPRISRAQSMDALSSQASAAGYKAVLMAADRLGKLFPMMMTAAGTVAPTRVLVMGAGVAGLQAIATARRLGAVVSAYDVRPAVKEEVQSLGGTFIELPLETQEGEGGYAREQSEEFLRKQRELIGEHIARSDVLITTAAVPGRRAPLLVTADMVRGMRPGSVIVDLASDTGGNVELTQDHNRHAQRPLHHALDDQSALRPQRRQPAAPPRQERSDRTRPAGRDHQGRLRDVWGRGCQRTREAGPLGRMTNELLNELTFFVLAIFVGFEVISKVPTILHTPLMSGTNAIHGIILVGAILIAAGADSPVTIVLGLIAVTLATTNVVGGFVVTDRMLEMFKGRQPAKRPAEAPVPK